LKANVPSVRTSAADSDSAQAPGKKNALGAARHNVISNEAPRLRLQRGSTQNLVRRGSASVHNKPASSQPRISRAQARWSKLRSSLREATRLVELRGSVRKLLEDLLQLCYCEMIVLTPVDSLSVSAKSRKYLDYIEHVHVVSDHGGAGGPQETANVLATIVASPGGSGPSGLCTSKQEPVLVENALVDTRFDLVEQRRLRLAGLSQLHVPLLVGQQSRRSSLFSDRLTSRSTSSLNERMEVIGVLSLINKVDGRGRTGKPFILETDMRDACATATMIVELHERYTEESIVNYIQQHVTKRSTSTRDLCARTRTRPLRTPTAAADSAATSHALNNDDDDTYDDDDDVSGGGEDQELRSPIATPPGTEDPSETDLVIGNGNSLQSEWV